MSFYTKSFLLNYKINYLHYISCHKCQMLEATWDKNVAFETESKSSASSPARPSILTSQSEAGRRLLCNKKHDVCGQRVTRKTHRVTGTIPCSQETARTAPRRAAPRVSDEARSQVPKHNPWADHTLPLWEGVLLNPERREKGERDAESEGTLPPPFLLLFLLLRLRSDRWNKWPITPHTPTACRASGRSTCTRCWWSETSASGRPPSSGGTCTRPTPQTTAPPSEWTSPSRCSTGTLRPSGSSCGT